MSETEKQAAIAAQTMPDAKLVVLTQEKANDAVVVCDVCGYVNPEHTAMCKMCSNYLEGIE